MAAAVGLGSFLVADGRTAKEGGKVAGKGPRRGRCVTAFAVQPRALEIYEDVVGSLENIVDPTIGAEVAGRVTRVAGFTGKKVTRGELLAEIDAADFEIQSRADRAEIGRLTTLLEHQERVVERQQKLVGAGIHLEERRRRRARAAQRACASSLPRQRRAPKRPGAA